MNPVKEVCVESFGEALRAEFFVPFANLKINLQLYHLYKYWKLKLLIFLFFWHLFVYPLSAKEVPSLFTTKGIKEILLPSDSLTGNEPFISSPEKVKSSRDSSTVYPYDFPKILVHKSPFLKPLYSDTTKLITVSSIASPVTLNELVIKNNFTKNLLGHFITSQHTAIVQSGVQSISYFKLFSGKKIASIRFVRLHPFGSSMQDTSLVATKWIEKAGNRLHMNTAKSKLGMQLLFKVGDQVKPLLMAENEKLMRDLSYLEDVSFHLEPVENSPDEVNVIIVSKDKFEYAISMGLDADNSDVEVVNENMFGLGHRLNIGMAQKNKYLPEMGIYFSYHVNNLFGQFINSTFGFSDTYLKKGWNVSAEKKILTSMDENAGGFSFDHVSKYNYISDNHPIALDTVVSYISSDLWFLHAFPGTRNLLNKTLLSFRYYHQGFNPEKEDSLGQSEFLRNHDFFLTGVSFARRNLYKNNLVYGYGVTEDIPYGHYYEITAGLDRSQFGTWPYLGFSLSNAFIDKQGSYYSGRLALDGFLDNGIVRQGTILANVNFFSRKFFALGDPLRVFINVEFLSGINRFKEEYLTIDGRFGIRDFYAGKLRGDNRLKINLETARYLKWNFYGFRFTNYFFTDFAFLSDKPKTIFTTNFYAGIGTGFRIYNESLVFRIIDIRLSWFPVLPDGMSHFGANIQGLTKSRFDDFLGRRSEVIRYQ